MMQTDKVIVVEGKYDAIKLQNIIDATILPTDGFQIFKDEEKQKLFRRLAEKRGLLVLTDSDSAGFLIRHFLEGSIPKEQITDVYIPDLYGKERRKEKPGAEGKLGVEGVPDEILKEALRRAGVKETAEAQGEPLSEKCSGEKEQHQKTANPEGITYLEFYHDGFSGGPGSKEKRAKLKQKLALPEHLSGKKLLQVINALLSPEEYRTLVEELEREANDL